MRFSSRPPCLPVCTACSIAPPMPLDQMRPDNNLIGARAYQARSTRTRSRGLYSPLPAGKVLHQVVPGSDKLKGGGGWTRVRSHRACVLDSCSLMTKVPCMLAETGGTQYYTQSQLVLTSSGVSLPVVGKVDVFVHGRRKCAGEGQGGSSRATDN